jgi:DNA-directed RNA polymerase specialized sigma24 family protein
LSPEQIIEQRARRYLEIQSKLERLFAWRGCYEAEEMARAALDRAEMKWAERQREGPATKGVQNPVGYVCSFVRFMFLEWIKQQPPPDPPPQPQRSLEDEICLGCLDDCMEEVLDPEERKLILFYYEGEKGNKIKRRKEIAGALHTSTNALRIECYRIRRRLEKCVLDCVKRKQNAGSAHFEMERAMES